VEAVMDNGWKTAADPFTYHSPLCNLTTKQGLQACSCKPMIYDEEFAEIFWDLLQEAIALTPDERRSLGL
jgi:hypothetical protein